MASLQAYQSHGRRYYRIVESFRRDGKPHLRVVAHLGRVEDILRLTQQQHADIKVSSVTAGAVTALHHLAQELDIAGKINRALEKQGRRVQKRDGLTVGESMLAGIIGRACAPRSKRAFAAWAETTALPALMDFAPQDLDSQHFWDQMHALPVALLGGIEQAIVREVIGIEQLQPQALAYDTTNFYTHIASTNQRPELPQRGHNKQGRHDLRQLGLALVVDQNTQLPLAHALYEGARSDMRTFAAFLKPVRERLQALTPQPQQLTLVFDAGASSKANLEKLEAGADHYVTAVRPSYQQALLAEAGDHLEEITLSTGAVVRAWRTRRTIAGKERDAVVVFSPQLYAGQVRGLHQHLARCGEQLQEVGLQPRGTPEAVRRRLAQICGRQYLRALVRCEVHSSEQGETQVRTWSDLEEYRRLTQRYFGLRVLITDRSQWTTAQIVEAYRGQSRVETAFRDLKDPGMLATRPQFHWTDQKLHVHVFLCVTGYLLVRLLWRRARRDAGFAGSARNLLSQLARIRSCRIVEHTGRAGRPRVRQQIEEIDSALETLGRSLRALPVLT
ncbi:MAG: IS1634 family transposase [Bryobacterales bacterium]|nr:IS1634 family transposase [Bryobacterales bacterium]MCZ2146485.1 IS1634 family transposase [Bryobacterales bacterium]MCZ2147135.1 IS1634 family transposase [Bryobacterales bacterium]MCZ2147882.1 IS1634 family transposase [Bryobacterales bacterium]MCZ2149149.1 IS1634 family transposase [Bryobacterales bacterium]